MSFSNIGDDVSEAEVQDEIWSENCDSPGPPGVITKKTALLGVENARRRLKAFSIQKKQSSVLTASHSPTKLTASSSGKPKKEKSDRKAPKKDKKESTYNYMVNKLNEMKASDDIKKKQYGESLNSMLQVLGLPSSDKLRPLKIYEMEMIISQPYDKETTKLVESLKVEHMLEQPVRERTASQTSLPESSLHDLVVCDSWSIEEDSKEKSEQKATKNKSKPKSNSGLSMISELYSPELSSNSNSPENAVDTSATPIKNVDLNHFFISQPAQQKKKDSTVTDGDIVDKKEKLVIPAQIPEATQSTAPTFQVDKFGFLIRNTVTPLVPVVSAVDNNSKEKSRSEGRRDSRNRRSDRRDDRERRSGRRDKDKRDRRHGSRDRDNKSRHRKDDERRNRHEDDSKNKRHSELRERKEERRANSKRKSVERDKSANTKDHDNVKKHDKVVEESKNEKIDRNEKNLDTRSIESSEVYDSVIHRTKFIEHVSNAEFDSVSKHSDSNSKYSNSSRLPDDKILVPRKDGSVTSKESALADSRSKLASEWENSQSPEYVVKMDTQWERSPTPVYKRADDFSSRREFCADKIIVKDVWEDLNDSLEKHALAGGDSICSMERTTDITHFNVVSDYAADSPVDKVREGEELKEEGVDYWKDVTEACGPYHHVSEKCYRTPDHPIPTHAPSFYHPPAIYQRPSPIPFTANVSVLEDLIRKTTWGPVISYCENLRRCDCKAQLSDKFEKLSCNAEKIKQLLSPTHDSQSTEHNTANVERVWYPDERQALNDKPAAIELESNWERDDDDTPPRDELLKFNRNRRRPSVDKEKDIKSVDKNDQLNEKEANYKLRPTVVPDDLLTSKNVVLDAANDFNRSSFLKGSLLDISIIPTPVIDSPHSVATKETPAGPPSLDLEYEKFMEAVGTEITDEQDENLKLDKAENSSSPKELGTPLRRSTKDNKKCVAEEAIEISKSMSNTGTTPENPASDGLDTTRECLDVSDIMEDVSKKRNVKDKEGKRGEKLSHKKKKDKLNDESEKPDSKQHRKSKSITKKKKDSLTKKRKQKKKTKKHSKNSSSSSDDSSSSSSSSDSSSDSSSTSSSTSDSSSSSSDSSHESKNDKRKKKKMRIKKKTLKVSPKSKKKFKKTDGKIKMKSLPKKLKEGKKLNRVKDKDKKKGGSGGRGVKDKGVGERKVREGAGEERGKTKGKDEDAAYSSDEEEMNKVLLAEKLRKAKKLKKKMSKKKLHDTKKHGRDRKEKEKGKKQGKKRRKNNSTSTSGSSSSFSDGSSEDDRKQKKKNKRKMEQMKDVPIKRKKTDEINEDFDMTLLNIKQEKVSDDEGCRKLAMETQFSPRIQRNFVHEIISINELHNDFVQSNKNTFAYVVVKTEKIDESEIVNEKIAPEYVDSKRTHSESNSVDSKRSDRSADKISAVNTKKEVIKSVSVESSSFVVQRDFEVRMEVVDENVNETFGEVLEFVNRAEESVAKDDESNVSSKGSDKSSSSDISSNLVDDNSDASSEHLAKPISPIEDSITASNNFVQNIPTHVQEKSSDNSQTVDSNRSFSNEREVAVKYSNEDVNATIITRPFENIGGKFISSFTCVDVGVPKIASNEASQSSQSVDSNEIVKRRMLVFPDPTKEIIQSPVKKPKKYVGKELPSSESEAELEHKRRVVEELDRLKKEFEEFRKQKLRSNDSERQAAAEELKRQFDMVESYTLSTKISPSIAEQKKPEVQPPMTDIRPIPTVTGVSASVGGAGSREEGLQGEIKWDWRPSSNTGNSGSGSRRPRPSRWGVVPKDQMQTNSTLIEVPIKTDDEFSSTIPSILDVNNDHTHHRNNHEHVDMMSDQEMLQMQAHYEASFTSHDDGNTIYRIPTISSTKVRDRVMRIDHEAKYEMYSEAQEMGYVTLMPDAESNEEEQRKAKKISLDERINLVLQFPGSGAVSGGGVHAGLGPADQQEPPPSPPQLPPSLALRAPPPLQSKGILVLGSVKIARLDPRAPPKCKKVCFSDGLAPGMDSDLEEDLQPLTKKAKSTKKAKRKCGGHSYPCPPHWPDYHPHYDSLPPPPPPPGSPPLSLTDSRGMLTASTVMNAPDAIITRLPRIPSHNETQLIA